MLFCFLAKMVTEKAPSVFVSFSSQLCYNEKEWKTYYK
ncbi:hypothetical protein ADIAL_1794 [Alkalibacterium sp. AK22]|nr:hypothetical protein ADIAL_1794 [Alkalibacterium sp. AK22]